MIINKIEIDGFGKLSEKSLTLAPGFNLIYGANEDGKTTLMSFVKMMFYSSASRSEKISDLSKSLRKKYRPWNGSQMSGAIEFTKDDTRFRIQKTFMKSEGTDKTVIFNLDSGQQVKIEKPNEAGEFFLGMTLDEFDRSVFFGQTGGFSADTTGDSLALRISNLTVSGDENTSQDLVVKHINEALEELCSKSGKKGLLVERTAKLQQLNTELQDLEQLEKEQVGTQSHIDELESQISQWENTLNAISNKQTAESAQKELNAYYALQNKQNLLRTEQARLDSYGIPIAVLEEYIADTREIDEKISQGMQKLQEIALNSSSPDISEDEYKSLENISNRIDALGEDIEIIKNRILPLEEKLTLAEKQSNKIGTITAIVLFVLSLIGAICVMFLPQNYAPLCLLISGFGFIVSTILFFTNKNRTKNNVNIQFLNRDLKDAICRLKNYSPDFSQMESQQILTLLKGEFTRFDNELKEKLALHNAENITKIREKSAVAQAENIEEIKIQIQEYKDQFLLRTTLIKDVSRYTDAKIFYNELSESLDSIKTITDGINTICTLSGITNTDEGYVKERIAELFNFLKDENSNPVIEDVSPEKLRSDIKNAREELNRLRTYIRYPEKTFSEIYKDIKATKEEIHTLETRQRQLEIANLVMQEAILDANKGLGSHLSTMAGKYLEEISGGKYSEVIVPRDLNVETKAINSSQFYEWKYLSGGAIDRLYLALRLAITDIIAKGNQPLPLLLDDIFTQYDDENCSMAFKFLFKHLKDSSSLSQIIFFTCHKHIAEMAKETFDSLNEISL